ncbi:MAG: inositol monophosphatase family protein, partial [Pseudomonadota bacterium]
YVWIIDPLDGTTNFIHGFPVYAVSIALAYRGQVQQAVVYDPTRNDLFYASKGKGAYLNDRRIRVSKRTRMLESLIGTGFPFRKGDNFQRYMKMFEEVMVQCAGLRRPGAASLDLCYVAAGYLDGFFETGLSPWDVAAGSLMITEAGGLVGNFTGEPDFLYQREILAGSPRIYGQLVKTLAPYTRVIAETAAAPESEPGESGEAPRAGRSVRGAQGDDSAAHVDAHDAALEALKAATAAPQPEVEPVAPKRTRITASAKAAELASGLGDGSSTPSQAPRGRDDAPF